jgi:hypothetical protein
MYFCVLHRIASISLCNYIQSSTAPHSDCDQNMLFLCVPMHLLLQHILIFLLIFVLLLTYLLRFFLLVVTRVLCFIFLILVVPC